MRHNASLAVGLSLGVLLLVCIHWWHPGQVIAQGDNPPLITPGIWFLKALGAWSVYNTYFGQVDGSFTFFPFMLLWWPADQILGASLGQIATHFVLIAAAWTGAYFLVRIFGATAAAAAIGAWLYTINPFTQLVFGNVLTLAVFFALLPWMATLLAGAALFPARRGTARLWLTIFAFAAIPILGVTPSLVFQITAGAVMLAGLCWLLAADRRIFLRWALYTGGAMILAALWWAIPDVLSFVGATIPHPTALSDLTWTYARASLLNDLRFLYTWLWALPEYYPVAPAYDANLISYAAGFLAIAIATVGLIVLNGRSLLICRFALGVALVVVFITKGTHPPLAFVNTALAAIPGAFLAYADPAGGVALALLLLSIAAALTIDAAVRMTTSLAWRYALQAATLALIVVSGWPLISGAVFHGPVVASNGALTPSVYVSVPTYWSQAADYLNSARGDDGVLMLPPHLSPGYDVEYGFGYYGVDAVATNLIRRRLLYLDAGLIEGLGYLKHTESQSVSDRIRTLLDTDPALAQAIMHDIGIRYVLYRGDIVHQQNAWYSQAEMSVLLHRTPKQFGPLAIYDLGTGEDLFGLHARWIAGSYGGASAGDLAELAAVEEPLPRVNAGDLPSDFSGHPALVEQSGDAQHALALGKGVDRAISFGSSPPVAGSVVISAASARELRVSAGAAPLPMIVTDVPTSSLRHGSRSGAALLAAHVLSFSQNRGSLSVAGSLQNIGVRAVWADFIVTVPARPARRYSLAAEGSLYRPVEQTNGQALTLRFASVLVAPGQVSFELAGEPSKGGDVSDSQAGTAGFSSKLYSFYFTNVRAAGAPAIVGSVGDTFVDAGTLPLQYDASDYPNMEVTTGHGSQVTAVVDFTSSGKTYSCPVLLQVDQGIDMDYAIAECIRQNSLTLPVRSIKLVDVHIVAAVDQPVLSDLTSYGRLLVSVRPSAFTEITTGSPVLSSTARVYPLRELAGGFTVAEIDPTGAVRHRAPVTIRWRLDHQALQATDVIAVRVDGCGGTQNTSSISLTAAGGIKPQVYRQQLFATPDGAEAVEAAFSLEQAFGRQEPRLLDLSAKCFVEFPTAGAREVRARLQLLRRWRAPVPVHASGIRTLTLPTAGVVARALPNAGVPLPVQFGDLPSTASVAVLGGPPVRAGSNAQMDCRSPGVRCSTGMVTAAVPAGFKGLAVFSQLYSPTWFAIKLGPGLSLPAHVRADGWRNAWYVSGAGELIIVNLLNLLVMAGVLLGLGVIAWQLKNRNA
ncbi:MAG TPA: alpha-(1-_3)-arabinofuranosyltransferase family protein [Candidatus Rubrimentiphilum sp.]|nr:alpha-(1->3)-arabinofuranosyltransferase family protein [Candidatus Rubrimentiphilum sp.]